MLGDMVINMNIVWFFFSRDVVLIREEILNIYIIKNLCSF